MSDRGDAQRDRMARERIAYLQELIAKGGLTPERERDYLNEINGLKASLGK